MSSSCCAEKISIAPINLIISSSTVVLPEKFQFKLIVSRIDTSQNEIAITLSDLPWMTFRTSLDVRLPITMRRRGNWSVLYVRIVCVTTLPKCLVHMVSNLEAEIKSNHLSVKRQKRIDSLQKKEKSTELAVKKKRHSRWILHKNWVFTPAFSICSGKDKHVRLMELSTMLPFPFLPPISEWHAIWMGFAGQISIPHQAHRLDRARRDFLFHYKDRTF